MKPVVSTATTPSRQPIAFSAEGWQKDVQVVVTTRLLVVDQAQGELSNVVLRQ